jgi:hypothetical protein
MLVVGITSEKGDVLFAHGLQRLFGDQTPNDFLKRVVESTKARWPASEQRQDASNLYLTALLREDIGRNVDYTVLHSSPGRGTMTWLCGMTATVDDELCGRASSTAALPTTVELERMLLEWNERVRTIVTDGYKPFSFAPAKVASTDVSSQSSALLAGAHRLFSPFGDLRWSALPELEDPDS